MPTPGLYEFFALENWYGWDYGEEPIKELLKFADRFAPSRYARHARFGAGLLRFYARSEVRDVGKAVRLFQEVAREGDDLAARAFYDLGQVAEQRGEWAEAAQSYERALSLKIDPYFRHLAEKARARVESRLSASKR